MSVRREKLPQVQLRTILLIFFCAAIGMTCATAPPAEPDPELNSLGIYLPQLNLHYAMLYAASMAMVIGLGQQINNLLRSEQRAASSGNGIRIARNFAIGWRIIIAATILVCTASRILLSRRMMQLPEHDDFFGNEIFPDTLALICVIVVLTDSIDHWRPNQFQKASGWITGVACAAGLVLALIILPDTGGLVRYLVHIATEGIERAQRARFQRVGTFPDHRAESFRLFWLSLSAVAAVVLAAIGLVLSNSSRLSRRTAAMGAAVFVALLSLAAAFCAWFYISEHHRVSPDLASVGLAANWLDWASGGILASILISAGAYRFAASKEAQPVSLLRASGDPEGVPLHESFLCLLLLFGAVVAYFVETVRQYVNLRIPFGPPTIVNILYAFFEPSSFIMLAVCVLSFQLCWRRWKRRAEASTWELRAIDPRCYTLNWFALALLATIGVPTLNIYSFTFWLGPWYLHGS